MTKFLIQNNSLVEESKAKISIDDRGFLFGDGIFETCKIFNSKIYDFKSHHVRLLAGLKALKFSAEIDDLEQKSLKLIKKNSVTNGLLKIEISRGIGSVGYCPTQSIKPLVLIRTFMERPLPQKISLGISTIKKPPRNCLPIDCKTKQVMSSILTKIAATEQNFFDCIMLSQQNFISETSSANIFWVKNNQIFTPSQDCDMLAGTIRKRLMKLSPTPIKEVKAKISDLKKADEIFLTNSAFLVLPVDELVIKNKQEKFTKKFTKNFGEMFCELIASDIITQTGSKDGAECKK